MSGRRPLRLLVVDDHPIVRAGIKATLEEVPGWVVCAQAGDGAEAVRLALETMPDLVILDYWLPVLNGLEVTRQIRAASRRIEILLYTMHDDDALIRDALMAGARGYLLKSEDDVALLEAVDALSRGSSFFSGRVSDFLLDEFLSSGKPAPAPTLTAREREVVQLVAEGATNREIAQRWGVSIKTVDSHRTAAMRKLNIHTAIDLVRYAIRAKIIQP